MNRRERRAAGQRGGRSEPVPVFLTERIVVLRQRGYSAVQRPVAVAVNNDAEAAELVQLLRQAADYLEREATP